MIVFSKGEWHVKDKTGLKTLGRFKTHKEAVKRLRQIEWFKKMKPGKY